MVDYNISAYTNETFSMAVSISDSEGPLNLDGASAKMQIRKFASSPAAIFTFNSDTGESEGSITLNSGSLLIEASVEALTAANITAGEYVYDLILTLDNGKSRRILAGIFNILKGVTNV